MTRQLISVVTQHSVVYLIDDGDGETTQIAQVINRGLGVGDVVRLGAALEQSLGYNGNGRAVKRATPELPPARDDAAQARRIATGSGSTPLKNPNSRWMTRVHCPVPGCDYTSKRSNLATHLQTQQHGYTRNAANAAAREARPVDPAELTPQPKPKAKGLSRGIAGQRRIAGRTAPAVARFVGQVGTATSRQVADHFRFDPSRARKVLQVLVDTNVLLDVTGPNPQHGARVYAPNPEQGATP